MSPRQTRRAGRVLAAALLAAVVTGACGKKGPPLPPLVLLPAPPTEVAAVRRDGGVDLSFKIPASNTDRSAPADLSRVEVYAWTVPGPVSADEVLRRGTRVGSVPVNPPPDPDAPVGEERPRKEGTFDQDAVASIRETVPSDAGEGLQRVYVAVGVNQRGRRGTPSERVALPLVAPPPAPGRPEVTYDETAITVRWGVVEPREGDAPLAYAVYRADGTALSPAPIPEAQVADASIEWEQERCYEVRSVAVAGSARIESGASPRQCVTLHDTFAPAPPQGLVGVPAAGAISLIWTASTERDLAGYRVLRAVAPATDLVPVTPDPIADNNFRDTVPAGARVTYAVEAVDKAGNRSAPSERIVENAR